MQAETQESGLTWSTFDRIRANFGRGWAESLRTRPSPGQFGARGGPRLAQPRPCFGRSVLTLRRRRANSPTLGAKFITCGRDGGFGRNRPNLSRSPTMFGRMRTKLVRSLRPTFRAMLAPGFVLELAQICHHISGQLGSCGGATRSDSLGASLCLTWSPIRRTAAKMRRLGRSRGGRYEPSPASFDAPLYHPWHLATPPLTSNGVRPNLVGFGQHWAGIVQTKSPLGQTCPNC